jgi:membrane protein required for colicin V production
MEWVDWIILAVLVGSVLGGMAHGFFRSIFSLLGLILGVVLAGWNYARVAVAFKPIVRVDAIADAIGFLLIAVVVMLMANVAGTILKRMFRWLGLGCFDILGGAAVGFVQGALLVTVCILVTVAFFPQTEWLAQASLPKVFFRALHVSTQVSPDELKERVLDRLKTLEHESPNWMHEKNGGS